MIDILNWILFARIAYWGSHWSANVLIAIPVFFIFLKITNDRWKVHFWFYRIFFFLLDLFMVGTFTPSFHEVIFEPVLVVIRVIEVPSSLSAFYYAWVNNVEVWASLFIMFATATILGFMLYRKRMKFRLIWWTPFLLWFAFWSGTGLQVSLPFVNDTTWCHDCLWPNMAEFLYNLTFAIGIMGTFGLYSPFSGKLEKFKLFWKTQKKDMWDSKPLTVDDKI